MGLVAVTRCPVCGCEDRSPSREGIGARRKDAGSHYLVHVAEQMGVTIDEALEAIRTYQCSTCRSYFCDPWLSPQTAAYIFTEGAPDHIAGWANFEHWLGSPHLNSVEAANNYLYQKLLEKIGPISSYAEYACPFQGFLLLFRRLETTPKERVSAFSQAISRNTDIRWTIGPRLHDALQQVAHRMAVLYHRLRTLKHRKASQCEPTVELPTSRQLLTQGSTKAWGNNCVRYGASCNYYASKLLGVDVLPFDRFPSYGCANTGSPVDLLGIFNTLDHADYPMAVVTNALNLARHVLVVTHHAAVAGKQHLFAFHESFPHWLQSTLVDATVTDLSAEMRAAGYSDYAYLLISHT